MVGPRLEATDTVAIGTRLSEGGMRRRADGGDLYGRGEQAKQREPTALPVRSSAHSIMRVYTYVCSVFVSYTSTPGIGTRLS